MASDTTTSGRAPLIAAIAGGCGVAVLVAAAAVAFATWRATETRLRNSVRDLDQAADRQDERIDELAQRIELLKSRLSSPPPAAPAETVAKNAPVSMPADDPQGGGPRRIEGATAKLRTAKREEKIVDDLADLPKDGLEIKSTPAAGLVEHSLEAKGKEWVLKVAGKEACRFAHEKDKLTATFADYEKVPQRALAHGMVLVVKPSGSSKPLEVPLGEPLDLGLSIRSIEKGVDRLKPGGTYEFVSGSKKDIESFTNALGSADDLVDVIEFEGTADLKLVTKDGPDGGFAVVDKSTGQGVVLKREPAEKGKPVKYKCTHYVLHQEVRLPELKTLERAAMDPGPAKAHLQQLRNLKIKGGFMERKEYEDVRKLLDDACADLKGFASTRPPGASTLDGKPLADAALAEAESLKKCLPSVEDCELRIDQFGKGFRLTLRKSRGDSAGIVVVDSLNR